MADTPKPAAKTAEIYEILDPRDGSVRYIGKANNTAVRFKQHLSCTKKATPLYKWIQSLRDIGLTPQVRVRLVCAHDDWQEQERIAIAQGRADGLSLLNVHAGGSQPYCPSAIAGETAARTAKTRVDTPLKKKIYEYKRTIGDALRRGYVNERTKEVLRECARKRPDLFGAWANI